MEQPVFDRATSEPLRFHVKNTFLELEENDSDDSLELVGDFTRACTEPTTATPAFLSKGKALAGRCPPTEPQYVYTQATSDAGLGMRVDHPAVLSANTSEDPVHDNLRALELDPELAPMFESVKQGGAEVALKYYQDAELMQKLSKKMMAVSSNRHPPKLDVLDMAKKTFEMEETLVLKATLDAIRRLPYAVTLADPNLKDCPLIACSEGFEQLSGYKQSEVLGLNCRFLNAGHLETAMRQGIYIALQSGSPFIGVLPNVKKNGERFSNLLRLTTLFVQGKKLIVEIQSDVSNVGSSDPCNSMHMEELHKVASHIFAGNIDAYCQMQAQESSIQQQVPFSELFRAQHPQEFADMSSQFVILNLDGQRNAAKVPAACVAQSSFTEQQGSTDGYPAAVSEGAIESSITSCNISDKMPNQLVNTGNGIGLKSLGSAGHPDTCGTECIFFFFRSGCNAGVDCRFCHEFHTRKNLKKNRRMMRRLAFGTDGSDQMTASTLDENSLSRQISPAVLRFCYGGRWPVDGSTERLTLVVGQHVNIPVHLDPSDELQHMHPQGWTFTAEPTLPEGLVVDVRTGLLSGTPLVALAPCSYTFSVSSPSTGPGVTASQQVQWASFQMIISVVDLRQFNLSWCSVESETTDNVGITLSLRHPTPPSVPGPADETLSCDIMQVACGETGVN